jgi:cytoskeletal protein CcmA (bactofilin family)
MAILQRANEEPRGRTLAAGPYGKNSGTVIAPGAVAEGTLRTREPVRLGGTLRGALESNAPVLVEQGAQLEGQVTAAELVISGRLDAEVECQGRCLVRASALVRGALRVGTLRIEDGAWLDGQITMRPLDAAAREMRPRRGVMLPEATSTRPRAVGE